MAGGWNAQLIVDAPDTTPSSTSSSRRPPATSLSLAAAARRRGGRYARVDVSPEESDHSGSSSSATEAAMPRLEAVDLLLLDARRREESDHSGSSSSATEAAMARLEAVELLPLDARRRDAAAVLRAAWGCDAYKKWCASS